MPRRSEKFQEFSDGVAGLALTAFIHLHWHMNEGRRSPDSFVRKCGPCEQFVDEKVPSYMLSRCVWVDEDEAITASKAQIMEYMMEPLDK